MNAKLISEFISIFILGINIVYILINKKRFSHIKTIINNPGYIVSIIIIIFWLLFIFKFKAFNLFIEDPKRLDRYKTATTHGLIALIIAKFAYMDLTIPTFWFVLITTYFIDIPLMGVY